MGSSMHMKIRKSFAFLSFFIQTLPPYIRYAKEVNRRKPLFQSALASFTNTILPNAQNAALVNLAGDEFSEHLSRQQTLQESDSNRYIGVHLRRGDCTALSWEFHDGYVPISNYVQAIKDTWSRIFPAEDPLASRIYVASDSPTAQDELIKSLHSDVSVFSLAQSKNPDLQALASPRAYVQDKFSNLELAERIRATRGMIVDFALLNGMGPLSHLYVSPSLTMSRDVEMERNQSLCDGLHNQV
jgi:hypothetical protein